MGVGKEGQKRPTAGSDAACRVIEQREGWLFGTLVAWTERLLLSVVEKDRLVGQVSIRKNTFCVHF